MVVIYCYLESNKKGLKLYWNKSSYFEICPLPLSSAVLCKLIKGNT